VSRYYAASGRILGDEEDTPIAFAEPMDSAQDVWPAFVAEMERLRPDDAEYTDRESDDDTDVIVTSVVSSETPVKVEYQTS